MFGLSTRQVLAVLVAGLFVLGAGCAGLGASESGADATTNTTNATTADEQTTTDTTNESATAAASTDGDGHGHSHGGGTATPDTGTDDAAAGKLTVVIAGTELDLPARDERGGFGMAEDPHTWTASSNLTLAEALSQFGITARASSLSVDGETYRASTDGTTVSYRVNGEAVDPTNVSLTDGDQVWVTVETDGMNASVPGTYIDNEQQHIHGDMTVTVDGDEVDFSRPKYQSNDRYFHFEGGEGEYWHAHSSNITLDYALDSLDGVEIDGESLTVNGTTYDGGESGTTVTVEVNGEPIEAGEYFLKDGDDVRIAVERTGA